MLSSTWMGIKADWAKFEAWIASWMPGAKTKTVTALGALGSAAAAGQEYMGQLTGLPGNVVSGSQIAIASLVLFTLAFWLRGIGDRTAARVVTSSPNS